MIREDLGGIFLSVISSNRPNNVPHVRNIIGAATWYVGKGQQKHYTYTGADLVVSSGGLVDSRNSALFDANAHGLVCCQISDDLRTLGFFVGKNATPRALPFAEAITYMLRSLGNSGAKLCGAATTSNPFFVGDEFSHAAFIMGDLMLIAPGSPRFDASFRLKEDYDYTLQHLDLHGRVLRCNYVLPTFLHRSNRGGAVDYRDEWLEAQTIARLRNKWPGRIGRSKRGESEVTLTFARAKQQGLL